MGDEKRKKEEREKEGRILFLIVSFKILLAPSSKVFLPVLREILLHL